MTTELEDKWKTYLDRKEEQLANTEETLTRAETITFNLNRLKRMSDEEVRLATLHIDLDELDKLNGYIFKNSFIRLTSEIDSVLSEK